jgi:hypothetical protein
MSTRIGDRSSPTTQKTLAREYHDRIGNRAMPTRKEFDLASELYEEAVALYEGAKAEFEALETLIRVAIAKGEAPSTEELSAEETARAKLFMARVRLSRREAHRKPRY